MTTAFFVLMVDPGGTRFVTRAKNARSAFRGGQGRVPRRPMPREGVVATIRVKVGSGSGMDVVVDMACLGR